MDLKKLVDLLSQRDALEEVRSFIQNNPTKLNEVREDVYEDDYDRNRVWLRDGTLLHYSCLWNRPKVVSYLLSQNADVTKCFYDVYEDDRRRREWDGLTAQQIAEKRRYVDIVNLFEQSKREQAAREAERERVAREAAEREQVAREAAEREQVAREAAERERVAREAAERERVAREQAAREQAAREQAAREEAAREQAAREAAEKEKVITDWFCCISLGAIEREKYSKLFVHLGFDDLTAISLIEDKEMDVHFPSIPVGHRKKIWQQIQTLKKKLPGNTMDTTTNIHQNQGNIEATHNSIRLLDAPPSSSLQFSPIYGIADIKVTSLIEAIKPLASTNLVKHIDKYTQDALKLFSKNPLPTPLDLDETVAIHLYTKEWPEDTCSLYYVLNAQLRSEDRRMIKPFFPYIKILLMGLNKLEKTPGVTYRGVGLNLSKDYNIGEEIEWWAFTSTTTDGNACQGFLEKSPEKTLFRLDQKNGVNIQKFSQYPSESEVLLCPMKVLVKNKFKVVEGLWMVELEDLGIPLVNL